MIIMSIMMMIKPWWASLGYKSGFVSKQTTHKQMNNARDFTGA